MTDGMSFDILWANKAGRLKEIIIPIAVTAFRESLWENDADALNMLIAFSHRLQGRLHDERY